MDIISLSLARILFWTLAVCVLCAPLRWSFFCTILVANLDITDPTFTSSTSVGFENTFRVVLLPLILLLRLGFLPIKELKWTLGHKLWVTLTAYAAIAIIWTNYRLPALKMVAYLIDYFLFFQIFYVAWLKEIIDVRFIRTTTLAVVILAIAQTYILGDFASTEGRLTSYSTPQYFAAFLVAILAVLIFSPLTGWFNHLVCAAIVVAIVLSGSRYVFVSALMLLGLACIRPFRERVQQMHMGRIVVRTAVALFAFVCLAAALLAYFPNARVNELLEEPTTSNSSIEDIGTFAWRITIYAEMLNRLETRSAQGLFFGSGTSSGAELMLDLHPERYAQAGEDAVDGNRVLHSEFLRALYEWGVPGVVLLCLFVATLCVGYAKKAWREGGGRSLAFLGMFPSILFGLAIENLLAGAASAAGIGIVVTMAYAWCDSSQTAIPVAAQIGETSGET